MPVHLNPDPTLKNNLMSFGCECDKGWYPLINELIEKLDKLPEEMHLLQVKEKFGCYDDRAEILTNTGWKFFKNVTIEDQVACLVDGEKLEYHYQLF